MSQDEDETVEEFAQRVQQTMAEALNIKATAHTSSDKVEYAKQILFVQPQTGQSAIVALQHTTCQDVVNI